jgi:AcrR family transcriptional regulator
MAYEVTKRINGRDYRYRVETFRDPATGRMRKRWRYLGRLLDGSRFVPGRRRARVTLEHIVEATADLLESHDPARVTVAVIAKHAGVSQASFYRHFADRRTAVTAAAAFIGERLLREQPSLDGPLGTREQERRRLYGWLESLHTALLRRPVLRSSLSALLRAGAFGLLVAYLARLHAARLARVDDPERLADAIFALAAAVMPGGGDGEVGTAQSVLPVTFPLIEQAVFGPGS